MRLQSLKMNSQERRMERYRIIYIWKILESLVPNCGVYLTNKNQRKGRKCKIPRLEPNGRRAIQTLREQSFQVNGARLFNCLPKHKAHKRSKKRPGRIQVQAGHLSIDNTRPAQNRKSGSYSSSVQSNGKTV